MCSVADGKAPSPKRRRVMSTRSMMRASEEKAAARATPSIEPATPKPKAATAASSRFPKGLRVAPLCVAMRSMLRELEKEWTHPKPQPHAQTRVSRPPVLSVSPRSRAVAAVHPRSNASTPPTQSPVTNVPVPSPESQLSTPVSLSMMSDEGDRDKENEGERAHGYVAARCDPRESPLGMALLHLVSGDAERATAAAAAVQSPQPSIALKSEHTRPVKVEPGVASDDSAVSTPMPVSSSNSALVPSLSPASPTNVAETPLEEKEKENEPLREMRLKPSICKEIEDLALSIVGPADPLPEIEISCEQEPVTIREMVEECVLKPDEGDIPFVRRPEVKTQRKSYYFPRFLRRPGVRLHAHESPMVQFHAQTRSYIDMKPTRGAHKSSTSPASDAPLTLPQKAASKRITPVSFNEIFGFPSTNRLETLASVHANPRTPSSRHNGDRTSLDSQNIPDHNEPAVDSLFASSSSSSPSAHNDNAPLPTLRCTPLFADSRPVSRRLLALVRREERERDAKRRSTRAATAAAAASSNKRRKRCLVEEEAYEEEQEKNDCNQSNGERDLLSQRFVNETMDGLVQDQDEDEDEDEVMSERKRRKKRSSSSRRRKRRRSRSRSSRRQRRRRRSGSGASEDEEEVSDPEREAETPPGVGNYDDDAELDHSRVVSLAPLRRSTRRVRRSPSYADMGLEDSDVPEDVRSPVAAVKLENIDDMSVPPPVALPAPLPLASASSSRDHKPTLTPLPAGDTATPLDLPTPLAFLPPLPTPTQTGSGTPSLPFSGGPTPSFASLLPSPHGILPTFAPAPINDSGSGSSMSTPMASSSAALPAIMPLPSPSSNVHGSALPSLSTLASQSSSITSADAAPSSADMLPLPLQLSAPSPRNGVGSTSSTQQRRTHAYVSAVTPLPLPSPVLPPSGAVHQLPPAPTAAAGGVAMNSLHCSPPSGGVSRVSS